MTNSRLLLILALLALPLSHEGFADVGFSSLFYRYSWLFDGVCAPNNPVDQAWADEES